MKCLPLTGVAKWRREIGQGVVKHVHKGRYCSFKNWGEPRILEDGRVYGKRRQGAAEAGWKRKRNSEGKEKESDPRGSKHMRVTHEKITFVLFIEGLRCSRQDTKHFARNSLVFNPCNSSLTRTVSSYPFFRWGKWGKRKLRDLSVVILGGFGIGPHIGPSEGKHLNLRREAGALEQYRPIGTEREPQTQATWVLSIF